MVPVAQASRDAPRSSPLVVDLDGTLLKIDTLYETFASAFFRRPIATLGAVPVLLFRGIAKFKQRLSAIAPLEAETLPVRPELVEFLEEQRQEGRSVHLATAADQAIAERVAAELGLFDTVHASDGERNLKASRKAAHLTETFPEGFVYAGDCPADLAVWRRASAAIVISSNPSLERRVRADGILVERTFSHARPRLRDWAKAARPHQWSKNGLVLAPLALGWTQLDLQGALTALAALGLICVMASLTYFINDIADLPADRRHWSKRNRPFASGAVPARDGLLAAGLGIPLALALGFLLSPTVGALLSAYLVVTLSYSFGLKRVPMLDTLIIASLFTLRVMLGAAAAELPISAWLITFSMFFFFSLAIAKRHTELLRAAPNASGLIAGRGYHVEDREVTLVFGITASMASVLILVIYLVEEVFARGVYAHPQWLWVTPGAIFLWTSRVWLLSHRGLMNDDPVVFALRDRISLVLGAVAAGALVLAIL